MCSALGAAVGVSVGVSVGAAAGVSVGAAVGVSLGAAVGVSVGAAVGVSLGATDAVGLAVGDAVAWSRMPPRRLASSHEFHPLPPLSQQLLSSVERTQKSHREFALQLAQHEASFSAVV